MFLQLLSSNPGLYIGWIVVVGFSICVHEYAHAATAYRLGDDTAARAGHLTLNPMIQMGPMSLVMLFLLGIAWGLVPVDRSRLRKPSDDVWVSFAGPLSNVMLCIIFSLLAYAGRRLMGDSQIPELLWIGAMTNGALFILNMLPAPPLDGFHILSNFAPSLRNLSPQVLQQASLILIVLIFMTDLFKFVWAGGTWMAVTCSGIWIVLFGAG